MTEYNSRYPQLAFYVNGEMKRFSGGRYVTDDPADIAVLDELRDAVRVTPKEDDQPKTRKGATK